MSNPVTNIAPVAQPVSMVQSAAEIRAHVNLIQEVMAAVMKKDVHYGVIPGTDKPSLWKAGAEVLCATFRIAPSYRIEDLSRDGAARYRITCVGTHQLTGVVLGEGLGECSSRETKYLWRKAYQSEFDSTPEHKRRIKFGWNAKKREQYEILQVMVEPADVLNTVLKMAAKRAQVAMTINVTAASDIFTQDIEDLSDDVRSLITGRDPGEDGEDDKRTPGVEQPRSKSQAPSGEQGDGGRGQAGQAEEAAKRNAQPMHEGQWRIVLAKLKAAKLTEQQLVEKFGAKESITFGQFGDVQAWIAGGGS